MRFAADDDRDHGRQLEVQAAVAMKGRSGSASYWNPAIVPPPPNPSANAVWYLAQPSAARRR